MILPVIQQPVGQEKYRDTRGEAESPYSQDYSYLLNIQLLEMNRKNKRFHDGLETFLQQEIDIILPYIDGSENKIWSELKNLVAIRLMDKRNYYQQLEKKYRTVLYKYGLSLATNVCLGLFFIGRYMRKYK